MPYRAFFRNLDLNEFEFRFFRISYIDFLLMVQSKSREKPFLRLIEHEQGKFLEISFKKPDQRTNVYGKINKFRLYFIFTWPLCSIFGSISLLFVWHV